LNTLGLQLIILQGVGILIPAAESNQNSMMIATLVCDGFALASAQQMSKLLPLNMYCWSRKTLVTRVIGI